MALEAWQFKTSKRSSPIETAFDQSTATVGVHQGGSIQALGVEEISMSDDLAENEVVVPGVPSEGWSVLHLFYHVAPGIDKQGIVSALKSVAGDGYQVVTATLMGHKADMAVMALGLDMFRLRRLQSELQNSGLSLADSYVSLTEVSEYAKGLPEGRRAPRLYPVLPPSGMRAFCFYPMSKRREVGANWYRLSYSEREEQMMEHGESGRKFSGRIIQLITGSTGLDRYEWGVTLFGQRIDDIKDVVYTLRFDEVSAVYAEFGPFYVGLVDEPETVLATCLSGSSQ